jgi:hypothetical protein
MLLSSVERFFAVLKSKRDVVTAVLFLTPDYPISDFEHLEKILDDPAVVVFDLTDSTIDAVQVTRIPQLRFYHKEEVRKKLVGGDIFKWKSELFALEAIIRKEQEVINERASLHQKRHITGNRKENTELSIPICPPVSKDEKRVVR